MADRREEAPSGAPRRSVGKKDSEIPMLERGGSRGEAGLPPRAGVDPVLGRARSTSSNPFGNPFADDSAMASRTQLLPPNAPAPADELSWNPLLSRSGARSRGSNSGRRSHAEDSARWNPLLSRAGSRHSQPLGDDAWNPVLSRARSGSSNQGADYVRGASTNDGSAMAAATAFDPSVLLQEGIGEWKDRNFNLAYIKKAQSFKGRNADELLRSGSRGGGERRQEETVEEGVKMDYSLDLPKDFYDVLAAAPHAALIHLVILYHQALWKKGFLSEADKIAKTLSELRIPDQISQAELRGMDLLLKDGLLQYMQRVSPHLPIIPTQIVKFKGLSYSREVVRADIPYETMYTKMMGCLAGPLKKKPVTETFHFLKDVTGYLMPGTLTLIVGPPGCGMSILLKLAAGRHPLPGAHVEGSVTYNNKEVSGLLYQRLAGVIESRDVHLAPLSVRETLEFARDVSLEWSPKMYGPELLRMLSEALEAGQDPKLELTLSMLGLKRVADRPVGAQLTEDERHRLTAAEVVAGAYAVYLFDQLNAGLDDSVTYDLVNSLRIFTRVRHFTVMASLFQPSAEVYDLFDRVIVLDKGRVVFQGPREDVLPYFEKLGYFKPIHLGIGEFLGEVTTEEGKQYLRNGFPPLSLDDFVAAFLASDAFAHVCQVVDCPDLKQQVWVQGSQPIGLDLVDRLDKLRATEPPSTVVAGLSDTSSLQNTSMDQTLEVQPGDEVVAFGGPSETLHYLKAENLSAAEVSRAIDQIQGPVRLQLQRTVKEVDSGTINQQFTKDYILSPGTEFRRLLQREVTVTWRNKFSLGLRLFQILLMSFFTGFIFFRVRNKPKQTNMNLLRGSYFVSLLNMTLFNLGQIPVLMEERAIYYKQQGQHFYRPSTFLFAKIFGSMPFSLAEATIWTLIVYFMSGQTLSDNGWHFWVYYLILVLTVLNGASMVRFVSYLAPNREKANSFVGVFVALFVLFAGFLIPRFLVPRYWIWMYYLDPLQWGTTALVINEFNSGSFSMLCKDIPNILNLPQCVGRPENTIGHAYLAKGQFYTGYHWIGIAVACILGWIILFNALAYLALAKVRHIEPPRVPDSRQHKHTSSMQVAAEDVEWAEAARQKLTHTAIPVTLSWHELSFDIFIPQIQETRSILKYVSGWAEPGDMLGILGCTGSGKTTLLNCLAGRKVDLSRVGGQILVNGFQRNQKTFSNVIGYVDAFESYPPYMTVKEAVAFSATMSLGRQSTAQSRREFVEEILSLVEIKHFEDALVLSLGENVLAKDRAVRMAIASELASNPSVIFLDEPTKGLDTQAAVHVIDSLRHIAATGRTIISSLQHPSQRLLSAFTNVTVLKKGGSVVYFGAVGKNGNYLREYFEAIPGTPLCPPNKNASTFAIDVIGDGVANLVAVKDYAFEYRVSDLALNNHVNLQRLRRAKFGPELIETGYRASQGQMLAEVVVRMQKMYWRNVNYSWARMMFVTVMGLLLGSIYFDSKYHTTPKMNKRAFSIFISCVLMGITNAQNVIPQLLSHRLVYLREAAANHYSPLLYNIAWGLAEIVYLMVATMIFCGIFLGMSQIAVGDAKDFFLYWFILLEFTLAITFCGMFLAVVSPIPQIAAVLVPIVISMWVSTGGAVITHRLLLKPFEWMFWTNPLQYALNSLTSIAFFCDTYKPECLDGGANMACLNDVSKCLLCDCPRLVDANNIFVWTQLKYNRSLNHGRLGIDMAALAALCILFRFLAFIALWYRKKKQW